MCSLSQCFCDALTLFQNVSVWPSIPARFPLKCRCDHGTSPHRYLPEFSPVSDFQWTVPLQCLSHCVNVKTCTAAIRDRLHARVRIGSIRRSLSSHSRCNCTSPTAADVLFHLGRCELNLIPLECVPRQSNLHSLFLFERFSQCERKRNGKNTQENVGHSDRKIGRAHV
jgi:hypothetical protein